MNWTKFESLPPAESSIVGAYAAIDQTSEVSVAGRAGIEPFGVVIDLTAGERPIHLWSAHQASGALIAEGWDYDREVSIGRAEGNLNAIPGGQAA